MNRVKEEFVKFGENVSVRGVSKIVKSKRIFFKIMWLCAAVGCTGVLVWQLATLFVNYSSYPHKTAYGDKQTQNVFPSITLCSSGNRFTEIEDILYFTKEEYVRKFKNITDALNKSFIKGDEFFNSTQTYYRSLPKYRTNSNDSIPFLVDLAMTNIMDQPVYDENCTQLKHENMYHPDFYDCHLYQIPKSCNISVKSLTMILFTNTSNDVQPGDNINSDNLNTDGVKVELSFPGVIGDISKGFDLGAGTNSLVVMSMKVKTILDTPYNSEGCESKKYLVGYSDTLYSTFISKIKCVQDTFLEKCQCVSGDKFIPQMYNNKDICGNTTLAFKNNNLDAETEINKTIKAFKQLYCELNVGVDSCWAVIYKKPCIETYYERIVHTQYNWPKVSNQFSFFLKYIYEPFRQPSGKTYKYFKYYFDALIDYKNGNMNIEQLYEFGKNHDKIRSNFVRVKFIFTSDNPTAITDTPVYTWESILGTVGGSLSLWLGVTIMTFIEVIEFLCNLIGVVREFIIPSKISFVAKLPV